MRKLKLFLLVLAIIAMLSSCTDPQSTITILHTGEKAVVTNSLYTKGDTVIVYHTGHKWIIKEDWIKFSGDTFSSIYSPYTYYKAIVK